MSLLWTLLWTLNFLASVELLWMSRFSSFNKLGKSLLLCLQEFFLPLSHFLLEIPWCMCCYSWWCPTDIWNSIFLHIFSFCSSDWVIPIDLFSSLLILSSASLNMLLSPSSDFFLWVVLFNSIFYMVLFNNLYLYWYSLFSEITSSYFPLVLRQFSLVLWPYLISIFKVFLY